MHPDWWWPMPFFGMLMMPVMLAVFLVVGFLIVVPLTLAGGWTALVAWTSSAYRATTQRPRYPR